MELEIERKFIVNVNKLVLSKEFRDVTSVYHILQSYLHKGDDKIVRIRAEKVVKLEGNRRLDDSGHSWQTEGAAKIYIKARVGDLSSEEYSYDIPMADFFPLKNIAGNIVDKYRYYVQYKESLYHVDFFNGNLHGLVIAEIELKSEDQSFATPDWIDYEVGSKEYSNAILSEHQIGLIPIHVEE